MVVGATVVVVGAVVAVVGATVVIVGTTVAVIGATVAVVRVTSECIHPPDPSFSVHVSICLFFYHFLVAPSQGSKTQASQQFFAA